MRTPIRAIARRETALGLALSGLAPIEAASGVEAGAAIAALAGTPEKGGVILIERALYDALPGATRRQLQRDGVPVLMPFPGPESAALERAPDDELLESLRRAIGYRVRLR